MPSKRNIENLAQLKSDLQRCGGFLVLDCTGINVQEMTQLRRKLEQLDAKLKIYKNRLAKLAISDVKKGIGSEEFFRGPTALVFINEEPVRTIKFLFEYIKDKAKPKVKGCFVFDRVCSESEFPRLAELRPINEERAIFISVLQQPIISLLNTLQSIPQQLVLTIDAIKNKQGGE